MDNLDLSVRSLVDRQWKRPGQTNKLNRQELCYRYGWKFSSNMPDIYISRAGMETKALDEKFTQTEVGALKEDLTQLEQATKLKDERNRQLEESVLILQKNIAVVSRILTLNPTAEQIKTALRRKTGSVPVRATNLKERQ